MPSPLMAIFKRKNLLSLGQILNFKSGPLLSGGFPYSAGVLILNPSTPGNPHPHSPHPAPVTRFCSLSLSVAQAFHYHPIIVSV